MASVSDPVGDADLVVAVLLEERLGLPLVLPWLSPRKTSEDLCVDCPLALLLTPLNLEEEPSPSLLVVDESSAPHLVPALVTRPCPRIGPSPLTSRAVS
jgi:hypothetical protein